ncbi:MAG: rod shape-determining protein MreD [Acidimicrobiales bacterium]
MIVPPSAKLALVVVAAVVLQLNVVNRISIFGSTGDLLVAVAVAAGFAAGPEKGALVGFASGLLFDTFLTTPLGLTALVLTATAYGAGVFATAMIRESRIAAVAVAFVAAPVALVAWVVVGALLGQTHLLEAPLVSIGVAYTVVAVVTMPAVLPVVRWAAVDPHDPVRHRV